MPPIGKPSPPKSLGGIIGIPPSYPPLQNYIPHFTIS